MEGWAKERTVREDRIEGVKRRKGATRLKKKKKAERARTNSIARCMDAAGRLSRWGAFFTLWRRALLIHFFFAFSFVDSRAPEPPPPLAVWLLPRGEHRVSGPSYATLSCLLPSFPLPSTTRVFFLRCSGLASSSIPGCTPLLPPAFSSSSSSPLRAYTGTFQSFSGWSKDGDPETLHGSFGANLPALVLHLIHTPPTNRARHSAWTSKE